MRLQVISEQTTTFQTPDHTVVVHVAEEIEINAMDAEPTEPRPLKRSECEQAERPCPYVLCRYNLYLDVRGDGVLRINFPDREPDEMLASCALDMAEDGPRTLDQVAALMGMSKERARQLEVSAIAKLRDALGADELDDDLD